MNQDFWKFLISVRTFLEEIEFVEFLIPPSENLKSNLLVIEYNTSIQQYLNVFPIESKFKHVNLENLFFRSESIRTATSKALKDGIAEEISRLTSVEGWEEYSDNFFNEELLFLQYDDISSCYIFVKNQYQNPSLYIYWGAETITLAASSLSLYIRNFIFWTMIELIKTNSFDRTKSMSKWVEFYDEFTDVTTARDKLIVARHEFESFLKKNEIDEVTLDLDEYENKFIEFLGD